MHCANIVCDSVLADLSVLFFVFFFSPEKLQYGSVTQSREDGETWVDQCDHTRAGEKFTQSRVASLSQLKIGSYLPLAEAQWLPHCFTNREAFICSWGETALFRLGCVPSLLILSLTMAAPQMSSFRRPLWPRATYSSQPFSLLSRYHLTPAPPSPSPTPTPPQGLGVSSTACFNHASPSSI